MSLNLVWRLLYLNRFSPGKSYPFTKRKVNSHPQHCDFWAQYKAREDLRASDLQMLGGVKQIAVNCVFWIQFKPQEVTQDPDSSTYCNGRQVTSDAGSWTQSKVRQVTLDSDLRTLCKAREASSYRVITCLLVKDLNGRDVSYFVVYFLYFLEGP